MQSNMEDGIGCVTTYLFLPDSVPQDEVVRLHARTAIQGGMDDPMRRKAAQRRPNRTDSRPSAFNAPIRRNDHCIARTQQTYDLHSCCWFQKCSSDCLVTSRKQWGALRRGWHLFLIRNRGAHLPPRTERKEAVPTYLLYLPTVPTYMT